MMAKGYALHGTSNTPRPRRQQILFPDSENDCTLNAPSFSQCPVLP